MLDRQAFFTKVRAKPFGGSMNQSQVDGMNFILDVWEVARPTGDPRHLANALATTFHETAATMQPIEEYGKGSGKPYGVRDLQTGQTYYGRGDVQLTWRENYARADEELGLSGDQSLEWHAENALDPAIAAAVMFRGMSEGWFTNKRLDQYFNATKDDAFNARDIINADKNRVPPWSNGASIGRLINGYHDAFLSALQAAEREDVLPPPQPPPVIVAPIPIIITITIKSDIPVTVAKIEAVVETPDLIGDGP